MAIRFETRDINMSVSASDKGGVGKTLIAQMFADIMRTEGNYKASTALIDGDEKVRKFIERFGSRDAEGGLLPPEGNDALTGCRLVDLRSMDNSSAEIMSIMESGAKRILIDGAGGSESNYGKLLRPTARPEEFTEFMEEEGISANFIAPIVPDDDSTILSVAQLYAKYKENAGVFFTVVLNRWSGVDGQDPHFADWMNSKTRKAMVEAGNLAEIKLSAIYEDVMAKVRDCPVPFSVLMDKEHGQALGIDMRTRRAIKNARSEVIQQILANPVLKEIVGL
ncbi:P-loop NTPase family protein [Pseudorhizobium flavum]|uniref:hypothetical protein n=1 Tax=Pseudorhizobium flavum TaxID=1335061 RepID=UPI00376FB1F7